MNILKQLLLLLAICSSVFNLNAQSGKYAERDIDQELIIRLHPQAEMEELLTRINNQKPGSVESLGVIAPNFNIHLIGFDEQQWEKQRLIQFIDRQSVVIGVQSNHWLTFNSEPNDPDYSLQWGPERIGAPDVWDITTSGVTAAGDTIVVAVLDSGFELDHVDLAPNLWNNRHEIPGDMLDNDNNGYIDDTWGWDFRSNSNVMSFDDHGLSVAGILGAKGNNDIGVSGINWNIKLMLLTISSVDDVIRSYEYVIEQRKRYNESMGEEGAFVVATNASFGLPEPIFCSEEPVWGSMYDEMGAVGILTGAGTTNQDRNIDLEGDMPTTCESDFLITVLNGTEEEKKYLSTGYGQTHIDMAAPGQGSYTIRPLNSYGVFGGNSAAAPHLTGSIALLYGIPCDGFANSALLDPQGTAVKVREALIGGVDVFPAFQGITATGGRLNIAGALEVLSEDCGGSTGPLDIISVRPNPASTDLEIVYETPDYEPYQFRIYNALGQLVYRNEEAPYPFVSKIHRVDVTNLPAGTYFVAILKGEDRIVEPFVIVH
jgi:hypothetical protein